MNEINEVILELKLKLLSMRMRIHAIDERLKPDESELEPILKRLRALDKYNNNADAIKHAERIAEKINLILK